MSEDAVPTTSLVMLQAGPGGLAFTRDAFKEEARTRASIRLPKGDPAYGCTLVGYADGMTKMLPVLSGQVVRMTPWAESTDDDKVRHSMPQDIWVKNVCGTRLQPA
jgi:hypothetical protein